MAKKAQKPAAKAKPAAKKKSTGVKRTARRERVTGIGGVFFRAKDPQKLGAWYKAHLGIDVQDWGGAAFDWGNGGTTAWSPFETKTDYFGPGKQGHMINYRVKDLDAMLRQLADAGVAVSTEKNESEFGKFGWGIDLDGNRFELWEPPAGK